jgi:maleate cis-trans isomerase
MLQAADPLKSMSQYSPYGWRAKIGVIVPSTNVCTEAEWARVMPEGVSFHVARTLLTGATSQDSYNKLADGAEGAAQQLKTAEIDLVSFVCTSGSFMVDRDALNAKMGSAANAPSSTTADAILAAFEKLNITRVALATPYLDLVNATELEFLSRHGIEAVACSGLQLGVTAEERRLINRVPPEVVYRMAIDIDRPEAQAIFLSCTALPTYPVIEKIEQTLGKPVIASNPATLWHLSQNLGDQRSYRRIWIIAGQMMRRIVARTRCFPD